jgi:LacI family transcriptional regulator
MSSVHQQNNRLDSTQNSAHKRVVDEINKNFSMEVTKKVLYLSTRSLQPISKVNQEYLAERLGLSRTTVSRCFTNHPKINPETRAKVFRLASEIGYSYSAPRNGEKKKDTARNVIAVLVGMPASQIRTVDTAAEIFAGISEKIAAESLEMQLHYVDPAGFMPSPRPRKILPNVNSARWRGILLLYPFQLEAVRNIRSKFPVLSILDDYDEIEVDCVDADQNHGIRKMVHHLYSLGHREIGFLTWKYRVAAGWPERRLGAYVESLIHFNLPLRQENILNARPKEEIPLEELAECVIRRVRAGVTAWVCAADHQAYHLIGKLREKGLRVPEDVSLTGFDGVPPPPSMPQLTTVQVALRDIGLSAVHSLLRKIDNPAAQRRHILVTGKVITGETTTAPRG